MSNATADNSSTNTAFIHMLFESSKENTDSEKSKIIERADSKFTRGDLAPFILAIVSIFVCLFAGLLAFFLIQNTELANAEASMISVASTGTNLLQREIDNAIGLVNNLKTYMYLRDGNELAVHQRSEFNVFCYGMGSFPKEVFYFSYLAIVPDANRTQWIQEMRNKGPDYANFTMTYRTANNSVIPAPYAPVHYVASLTSPLTFIATNGYDNAASSVRNASIQTCLRTGQPTTGPKVIFSITTYTKQPGFNVYTAVYSRTNPTQAVGIVLTGFRAGDLIQTALDSMTKDVIVNVYDMNATDPSEYFMYSTTQWNAEGRYYSDIPDSEAAAIVSAAPFITQSTVSIADRTYLILFMPTQSFLAANRSQAKWWVLAAMLVAIVIFTAACVVLFFIRRVYSNFLQRKKSREQFVVLKEYAKNLRGLLNKIVVQQQKTRSTINALEDWIIVTNHAGKILQTNTSFDKTFNYTEQQLEKGIFINSIIPKLDSQCMKKLLESSTAVEMSADTREGKEIKLTVLVRTLVEASNSPLQEESLALLQEKNDTEEAYVVIGRSLEKVKNIE